MESNGHDDSGEIHRLFRFLTRTGPRFGLAIAICADRVLAAEAREQLREQVRAAGLRVATLELHYDDERHDIVQMMADASADADALFVVGLDRLVTDVFGRTRQTSAIANLNQRRDDLPQVLDARVVFWVAKAAYPSLSDVAWDFCQVMLTTAELEATRELVIDEVRVETPPEWLQLARADEAPQLQRQLQNLARLYETASDPRAAGDAAASVAELEIRLGHMASARTWFERAIAGHERAGQFGEAGRLSRRRAEMALFAGELDDAQEHAERARELARRAGNELDAALADGIIAEIVGRRGDVEAAIATLEDEVLPILVRLEDAAAQAEVLSKIANFREVRGELDEALELRKEQIAPLQQQVASRDAGGWGRAGGQPWRRDAGPAAQQANVARMVDLHVRKGELDEAARLTLSAPSSSAERHFAAIAEAQGNVEAASEIREREQGPAEPSDPVSQARALDGRAARLRSDGELEAALKVRREQELPIYEQLGDTRAQTVVLGEIADLLTALGRTDEASRVLEEQMLPRADRLGDARLQARASSKALQLRRRPSFSPAPAAAPAPAPEAKRAATRSASPASAAPARKPTADVPASPASPGSSAAPMSLPVVSQLPPVELSVPPPSPEPSSKALGGSWISEEMLDAEAELADAVEPEPEPEPEVADIVGDDIVGKPNVVGQPTAEPELPTSAGSRIAELAALLLGLALLVVLVLWLTGDKHEEPARSVQAGKLAACTVVAIHPDDTRSLVRVGAGESHVPDERYTVTCTAKVENVRVVVETESAAIHVLEWPPPGGLACSGTSACVRLYLGCGGTFVCTEHGELGCIAGLCREPASATTWRP